MHLNAITSIRDRTVTRSKDSPLAEVSLQVRQVGDKFRYRHHKDRRDRPEERDEFSIWEQQRIATTIRLELDEQMVLMSVG